MEEAQFNKKMEMIVESLKKRGLNPYAQLYGYLRNNDPTYITRDNDSRKIIETLNKDQIRHYVSNMER